MFFVFKIFVSALIIAAVSELGKRYTLAGAILASLPLVSVLAIIWLYVETRDVAKVVALSNGIMWAVAPSLLFFVSLSHLLGRGMKFAGAMAVSCVVMIVGYSAYGLLLRRLGIEL